MKNILTKEKFLAQYTGANFRYMLLDRMRSDCEYYINYEMNCPPQYNHLWADHDPKAQITYMKYLWESFEEKPEWLTMEEIERFERVMVA